MKTVLITGSSRGLGKAIAELFAQNKYNVILNSKTSNLDDLVNELKDKYQTKIIGIKCDISNEQEVALMFQRVITEFDSIDCVINNASICHDNDILSKTKEEFESVISTNLTGTFLVSKYAAKYMTTGNIVNIASTNGIDTNYPESIDYDASKAGIISLTHNFAKYLAPNIRVNCIAPGWINTDMTKDLENNFKNQELNKIMLSRFAEPQEIANVVYFVASDEASYINDSIIRVDGGVK